MKEQGYTVNLIKRDGFMIDSEVKVDFDLSKDSTIASGMGRMAEYIAPVFEELRPDYVAVLGDRYELLPICNTALIMHIPIIHFSGGDVTEGAIDNSIRNAVTMLSTYHFPGSKESAENIARMIGNSDNIWPVGEPGLDAFNREALMSKEVLSSELKLNPDSDWVLMTYHPETLRSLEYNMRIVRNCCELLSEKENIQVIATYANADRGGQDINSYLEEFASSQGKGFKVIPSLGSLRYLSIMKYVKFVIGNSSSGIVEAPSLGKYVINIGNRQKGRYMCSNILQCSGERESIKNAIETACKTEVDTSDTDYWGDGHTAERVLSIFKEILN